MNSIVVIRNSACLISIEEKEDGVYVKKVWESGRIEYLKNGKHHRLDGPAIVTRKGDQRFLIDGKWKVSTSTDLLNSEASMICVDGTKVWIVDEVKKTSDSEENASNIE